MSCVSCSGGRGRGGGGEKVKGGEGDEAGMEEGRVGGWRCECRGRRG
jgi:hypothetical protein